jgi:hypothetical protein
MGRDGEGEALISFSKPNRTSRPLEGRIGECHRSSARRGGQPKPGLERSEIETCGDDPEFLVGLPVSA